jgi:3-deoxy-D-manno-octulosonate 8-phosphate phosphatase (KDO 8-P phosphatase)
VKLLLLDADGVLTDGSIIYNDAGSEIKTFNVKDGLGIRMLTESGIPVGIVTGRSSAALRRRCEDLGINLLFEGIRDKAALPDIISEHTGIIAELMAFAGDDLPDLPIMKRVGFSIAVADAHPMVRDLADMVTEARGGRGAVRQVCEAILNAQGLWEKVTARFLL